MNVEIRELGRDQAAEIMTPVVTAFGDAVNVEAAGLIGTLPEFDVRLAALDDGAVVGAIASFSFEMTVPGGPVPTAGLTMVGVQPTHRRRGVLTGLMRRYLDDVRERGQPISALWATEAPIYGRFGYGLASFFGGGEIARDRAAFAEPFERRGRVRLVGEDAAAELFPPIYDRVRPEVPGMCSRSADWWRVRRLSDPEWKRRGKSPLQRAVVEVDGRPAAYALYRISGGWDGWTPAGSVEVWEAVGDSPAATRELWRYLLDIDIVRAISVNFLPPDHELLLLLAEPRRLGFRLGDGLWVRLVDVGAALAARSYGDGAPLVLEVRDEFCPWNEGRWRLTDGAAERTQSDPDLALDVATLGAAYLGAVSFSQLGRAGTVEEVTPGALANADVLFRANRLPWCPEVF